NAATVTRISEIPLKLHVVPERVRQRAYPGPPNPQTLARNRSQRVMPLTFRQREHVKRVAVQRMLNIRFDRTRNIPWAPAAQSSRYRDILLSAHREADRESLHRCPEPCFPQLLARRRIERVYR